MSTFQLNLTHKCNLNCPFCYSYRNNDVMSEEVMEGAIDFISNRINCEPINNYHVVSFSGGELFLGNWHKIPYIVDKIKNNCSDRNIHFILQSNFTLFKIEDNPEIQQLLEKVDSIGTSWDAGKNVRFISDFTLNNFWSNLQWLIDNKKDIEVIICLTKQLLIQYPEPNKLLMDLLNKGLRKIELERLCKPLEDRPAYNNFVIRPYNAEIKVWLTKAYKSYKKLQKEYPDFTISTFESMEDSVKGIYHYEYGRNCQRRSFTILPNGDVGQCFINVDKPFYNVLTKQLNIDNYEEICQREEILDEECKKCKYVKWCRGGCCRMEKDTTGCPTPYKIFDLIGEE